MRSSQGKKGMSAGVSARPVKKEAVRTEGKKTGRSNRYYPVILRGWKGKDHSGTRSAHQDEWMGRKDCILPVHEGK